MTQKDDNRWATLWGAATASVLGAILVELVKDDSFFPRNLLLVLGGVSSLISVVAALTLPLLRHKRWPIVLPLLLGGLAILGSLRPGAANRIPEKQPSASINADSPHQADAGRYGAQEIETNALRDRMGGAAIDQSSASLSPGRSTRSTSNASRSIEPSQTSAKDYAIYYGKDKARLTPSGPLSVPEPKQQSGKSTKNQETK